MTRETIKTLVTAIVTLGVLGVMAAGALFAIDVGMFEQFGAVVIGYWFGAGAQEAVSRARHDSLPSVL